MPFDPKRLSKLDWMIAGGGAAAFIAGFLPWWGYTGPGSIYSASVSGWSSGFTGFVGILLLTLAGAYLVLRRAEVSLPDLPVGPAVVVAGASAIGLAFVVLRWLTLPRASGGIGHIGPKFGIWLAMIAGVVQLIGAIGELRESGEPMPWASRSSSS